MFAGRLAVISTALIISATGQFLDAQPRRLHQHGGGGGHSHGGGLQCTVGDPTVSLITGILPTSNTAASACTTTQPPTVTTTTTTSTTTTTTVTTTTVNTTTVTTTTSTTTAVTTTTVNTTTLTTTTVTTTTTTVTTTTVNTTTVTTTTVTTTTTLSTTTTVNTTVTTTVTTTTVTTTTTTTTVTTTTVNTTTVTTTTNPSTTTVTTVNTTTLTTTTTTVTTTTVNTTTVTTTTVTTTTTTTTASTTTVNTTTVTTTTVTTTTVTTTVATTTTTGCGIPCTSTGYSTTSACNSLAAGSSQSSCARRTGDALVEACFPATFAVKCPSGNYKANTPPDFATSSGITCRACGGTPSVVDKDPQQGKYWVQFSFGDLITTAGNIQVANIDEYQAFWVDSKGRAVGSMPLARIKTWDKTNACCNSKKYSVKVTGNFSTTYSTIAVRAKSNNGVYLPFMMFTQVITDVTSGVVNKHVGTFTFSSTNTAALSANPAKFADIMANALAESITGVDADDIQITEISVGGSVVHTGRRLTTVLEQQVPQRRLAAAAVSVKYVILAATTIAPPTISTTALTTAIVSHAAQAGITVAVSSVSAPAPTGTTVGTAPAAPGTTTGSASALAFHMMAIFIAGCAHFLL